jgi:hypothetical protein
VNFQGPGDDEPFRVNKRSITQLDDYKALFDGSDDAEATGEASYSSMYVSGATERIHRRLPHAKLIAILRDPVERAHSNFIMMVEQGREPLGDFAEALSREEERIRNDWGPAWHYKQLGCYFQQLRPFYNRFDADHIKICLYEDLVEDGPALMRELFAFLGVEEVFQPDLSTAHNPSGRPAFRVLTRLMRSRNPVRRGARLHDAGNARSRRAPPSVLESHAARLTVAGRSPRTSPPLPRGRVSPAGPHRARPVGLALRGRLDGLADPKSDSKNVT